MSELLCVQENVVNAISCLFQFPFNDSHSQMIIHWAGLKSDVIIALTKGPNIGSSGLAPLSSHVYVSHNYGETFSSIDNHLKLYNGRPALIDQYFTSPVFNTHVSTHSPL